MHILKLYAVMFVREGLETEEFEETLEIFQEYNLGASHKVKIIFMLKQKPLWRTSLLITLKIIHVRGSLDDILVGLSFIFCLSSTGTVITLDISGHSVPSEYVRYLSLPRIRNTI